MTGPDSRSREEEKGSGHLIPQPAHGAESSTAVIRGPGPLGAHRQPRWLAGAAVAILAGRRLQRRGK